MKIYSDNKAIEKNLRRLHKAIDDYGGWVDEDIAVKCEGGGLSVERHGFPNPKRPIIALPGELLLPTEKMGLSVKNGSLDCQPDKKELTDIQIQMAECMVELYNLTDKIALHEKACCWFVLQDRVDLLNKLVTGRTPNAVQKKFLDFAQGKGADNNRDEILCDTFIKTRTIGHKQAKGKDDEMVLTTDIMPIVDFINHHFNGAFFGFRQNSSDGQEREFLHLHDSRPLPFSNQCFAFYNQMDTLDSFLTYGFPDVYAPYVRSVPFEFEVPKTGKMVVHAMQSPLHKGVLPQHAVGLRPYIPHTVKNENDVVEVTHLFIPTNPQTPQALRRVLRLLVSNMVSSRRTLKADEIWECVLETEEKIINANLAFYKDVLKALEKGKKGKETEGPESIVRLIAETQLTKLYKYNFDESRFENEDAAGGEKQPGKLAAAE